ncbi:MAG: HK97 family phage prohead protease [Alkalilacustris sp.]
MSREHCFTAESRAPEGPLWAPRVDLTAEARIKDMPSAPAAALADIAAGTVRGLSVGYGVSNWREARESRTLVRTATAWAPLEVSVVPIPTDAGARFRGNNGRQDMTEDTTTTPAPAPATTEVQTRAAVNAENRTIAETAGLGRAWADGQIDAAVTVAKARAGQGQHSPLPRPRPGVGRLPARCLHRPRNSAGGRPIRQRFRENRARVVRRRRPDRVQFPRAVQGMCTPAGRSGRHGIPDHGRHRHKTLAEVERYPRAALREGLADAALVPMPARPKGEQPVANRPQSFATEPDNPLKGRIKHMGFW